MTRPIYVASFIEANHVVSDCSVREFWDGKTNLIVPIHSLVRKRDRFGTRPRLVLLVTRK